MSGTSQNFRWRHRVASRIRDHLSRARERCLTYRSVGRWGERVARQFLSRHGAISIQTNWRASRLEADIIAVHHNQIVVVEVKTRHHSLQPRFPGIAAVTEEKWERLKRLGEQWMRNNGPACRRYSLRSFRVDVVEIYYRPLWGLLRMVTDVRWHTNAQHKLNNVTLS